MADPDSWTPELETGYQKYVKKKHTKNLLPRDRDGWRRSVQRWAQLKALGDGFRDELYRELGCLPERGYGKEFYKAVQDLGGRRKDIAAPALKFSIEVKYGAAGGKKTLIQLEKDARILERNKGWVTIWIVQDLSKLSTKVRERQRELEAQYPGRFLVREASPAARERVTEEIRELLRGRESRAEQRHIAELGLDLQDLLTERERTPGFGVEREREITAQLAEANSRWMQIEQELTFVREQRAQREHALDIEVEREQFRRALEKAPQEHELLRAQLQHVRETQLAERQAHAGIWQTELQGRARAEHAHALAVRETAERQYRALETEVKQRLSLIEIEPVNREQLQVRLEQAAHHDRVLTERANTHVSVLDRHLTVHAERERDAASREYDIGIRRQRENTAAALDHNRTRFAEMAKDIDREVFLAWASAGRDESRLQHVERDGQVFTTIPRPGSEPLTVQYDSKERELALAVTLAREGLDPSAIVNVSRASRDSTTPAGFRLMAENELEQRRQKEERARQRHQEQHRAHERER